MTTVRRQSQQVFNLKPPSAKQAPVFFAATPEDFISPPSPDETKPKRFHWPSSYEIQTFFHNILSLLMVIGAGGVLYGLSYTWNSNYLPGIGRLQPVIKDHELYRVDKGRKLYTPTGGMNSEPLHFPAVDAKTPAKPAVTPKPYYPLYRYTYWTEIDPKQMDKIRDLLLTQTTTYIKSQDRTRLQIVEKENIGDQIFMMEMAKRHISDPLLDDTLDNKLSTFTTGEAAAKVNDDIFIRDIQNKVNEQLPDGLRVIFKSFAITNKPGNWYHRIFQ